MVRLLDRLDKFIQLIDEKRKDPLSHQESYEYLWESTKQKIKLLLKKEVK